MKESFHSKLNNVRKAIQNAEFILIGGGAGLSVSAGLRYDGKRFTTNFPDFISRYGMTDMYSAGFYPFRTQEEKWAYWSRHITVNRFDPGPKRVYCDLLKLVEGKKYFVITTNVDGQFTKAGFAHEKIFPVQGDYAKNQCATACHQKLYGNEDAVRQMVTEAIDCRIPSRLVPNCPRCGGRMVPNLRKDRFFVEDDAWRRAWGRFRRFVASIGEKPPVFLELGVGFNTPTIIKIPFERMTAAHANATLVRINRDHPEASLLNKAKTISFARDIGEIITALHTKSIEDATGAGK